MCRGSINEPFEYQPVGLSRLLLPASSDCPLQCDELPPIAWNIAPENCVLPSIPYSSSTKSCPAALKTSKRSARRTSDFERRSVCIRRQPVRHCYRSSSATRRWHEPTSCNPTSCVCPVSKPPPLPPRPELLRDRRCQLMMANKRVGAGTTAGPVMCGSDGNRMMDSQPAASSSNREQATRGGFFFLFLKKKKEPRQLLVACCWFSARTWQQAFQSLTTLKIKPRPPRINF